MLQRRLRILTLRLDVARLPAQVYAAADADAILLLLMHKIGAAAAAQGMPEGRALLQDWLVLFTAAYNRHLSTSLTSAEQARSTFAVPYHCPAILSFLSMSSSEQAQALCAADSCIVLLG